MSRLWCWVVGHDWWPVWRQEYPTLMCWVESRQPDKCARCGARRESES